MTVFGVPESVDKKRMSLPNWATRLKKYNSTVSTDQHGSKLSYEERLSLETNDLIEKPPKITKKRNSNDIPKFFHAKNSINDNIINNAENETLIAVSEIIRELFLDNHEERLLSEHDLDSLFSNMLSILNQYNTNNEDFQDSNNTNCFLNYETFRLLKESLPQRAHKFFTASVFRQFPLNKNGKLRGISFHQFVSLSLNLLNQYITLNRYDINNLNNLNNEKRSPYLTENDLEIFIGDQIEMIPSLMKIDKAFHPYYIYHAVRKFMFILNTDNKKYIPITKILCSDVFREFNEFRFIKNDNNNNNNSDDIPIDKLKSNWFSWSNSLRIYKMYLELDTDHNGTLCQKEMLQYNRSSLSNLCIQRIFQYKKTWDQEMDYKGFLDFVLAVEHKNEIASLNYFWEILDLDGNGYLTPLTTHTLFRSVKKKMGIFGLDPINTEDVLNEIVDMVNPKIYNKITKQDLINSKMYSTVIDILTDVKGFWEYDNRESLVANNNNN